MCARRSLALRSGGTVAARAARHLPSLAAVRCAQCRSRATFAAACAFAFVIAFASAAAAGVFAAAAGAFAAASGAFAAAVPRAGCLPARGHTCSNAMLALAAPTAHDKAQWLVALRSVAPARKSTKSLQAPRVDRLPGRIGSPLFTKQAPFGDSPAGRLGSPRSIFEHFV